MSGSPVKAGAAEVAVDKAVDELADGLSAMKVVDKDEITRLQAVYDNLVAHHPVSIGKALSSKERDEKGLTTSTLVYGEIAFDSYAIAFQKIKRKYGGLTRPGGRFYDIGSGTGKPILEGLHSASLELLERWKSVIVPELPEPKKRMDVQFLLGDATTYDWSDATLWFANSTCFDEALMLKLAVVADKQAVGTFAITFTKRLPSSKWEVLEHEVYQMSWGNATVYIQRKNLE